jgi:hypothetical protein
MYNHYISSTVCMEFFVPRRYITWKLWNVETIFQCTNLCVLVLLTCYILPRQVTLQDCFTVMPTWQHRRNILLRTCQECSAVTARPRYKIRTLQRGNTRFATTFPSLHFSIIYQIAELSYGLRLMGQSVLWISTYIGTKHVFKESNRAHRMRSDCIYIDVRHKRL